MTTMDARLAGKRVLLVEDEYFIAKGLARDLRAMGCDLVGPAPSVAEALRLIASGPLDGAVLDVNLRGEVADPVADALEDRHLPFVIATGYSAEELPSRYKGVPHCEKPVRADALAAALFRPAEPPRDDEAQ